MSANPQSNSTQCPKCARPLPANAPEGICPLCLFANMLQPAGETEPEPARFAPGASPLAATRQLGAYELLDEVARGGMGIVYRARHRRLNRIVALKMVLTSHLAGEVSARRFRMEAEAAASLDHPHIVPIYEVGEADGRLFYTMKLIEGGALSQRIGEIQLRLPAAGGDAGTDLAVRRHKVVTLLIKIARAVHHAHQRGLLHRDLKPSNILLDAEGEPAVTDFGLARWMEDDNELTVSGTVMGSPSYMSPEQAAGRGSELTTAADVYGLGAVMFYLLTGRAPFAEDTAMATMRAVTEREAPRPSSLNSAVDADLDTICSKCLQKDPARRYQSARALAEELERTLRGEPIQARPTSAWERAWKWGRRNPARALLSLMLLFTPAIIITMLVAGNTRVQQAQTQTRLNLYAADMQVAQTALEDANLALARQILANYLPRPGEPDLRGFEWRHLWLRARSGQLRVLRQHAQPVNCVQFSPDGNWLASCEVGRTVWFWNTTSWKPERVIDWSGESKLPFRWVSFSRDSQHVALSMDGYYSPLFDFEKLQSDICIFARELEGAYLPRLMWSPVSAKLAFQSVSSRGERFLGVLDWAAFEKNPGRHSSNRYDAFVTDRLADTAAGSYPDAPITRLADAEKLFGFRRSGELLAGRGGELVLYDIEHGGAVSTVASSHRFDYAEWSPDGKFIAGFNSQPKDRHSVLMDEFLPNYTNSWEMIGHEGEIRALAIAPDSRQILSGSADHTARVWDVSTRKTVATLRGHADEVTSVAWSPDGRLIATGSKDRTVMLWSVTDTNHSEGMHEPLTGLFPPWVLADDGTALIGYGANGSSMRERHLMIAGITGKSRRPLDLTPDCEPLQLEPGGKQLRYVKHATDGDWELHRIDLESQSDSLLQRLPRPGAKTANLSRSLWAISPDSRWLAHAGEPGSILIWSLGGATTEPRVLTDTVGTVRHLAFAPGSSTLAVGCVDEHSHGKLFLWQASAPERSRMALDLPDAITALAWSMSGEALAVASEDRGIRMLSGANGEVRQTLAGHKRPPTAIAFSADGRTLASADGRTVKLWHTETGREMLTLYRDLKIGDAVTWLRFTSDGNRLLAGDLGGQVQVFQAAASGIEEL